jgi:ATP-dependent Lon protease
MVFLLAAKNGVDPQGSISTHDLYVVGTIATVMRLIKIPEGGIKILVQGVCKARALDIMTNENILQAKVQKIEEEESNPAELAACVQKIKKLQIKWPCGYTFSPDFHIIYQMMIRSKLEFYSFTLILMLRCSQKLLKADSQIFLFFFCYLSKEVCMLQRFKKN